MNFLRVCTGFNCYDSYAYGGKSSIKQVAEVISILVSNFPGAQYGPLDYHHLEQDKYLAPLGNKGDYRGRCNYPLPLYQNFSGGVIMQ